MTTIVAVQGDGWAVIGADSRVSDDHRAYTMHKTYGKISRTRGYLLGAAGDLRAINILQDVFTPPDAAQLSGRKLDSFITSEFIPALRRCFEEQGYAAQDEKEKAQQDSVVMVLVNGSVYEISEDYAWSKDVSGMYSMGSGSSYALGALQVLLPAPGFTLDEAKDAVKQALTISAKLDLYTAPPFTVLTQTEETQ